MFANFLQLIARKPSGNYDLAFIKNLQVAEKRSRRLERFILIGWLLIALKCLLIFWAVNRWHVPLNPWSIVAPTIAMAGICTVVYWRR